MLISLCAWLGLLDCVFMFRVFGICCFMRGCMSYVLMLSVSSDFVHMVLVFVWVCVNSLLLYILVSSSFVLFV